MNKILHKSFNSTKIQKNSFINRIITNTEKALKFQASTLINTQKKHFSVDYTEMEKKLNAFYESQEKAKLEYLKSIMTEKEKREAEIIFDHIEKLDETERDYFNVKLESEMKKLFDVEIMKNQYTISNLNMFNPIEIDGNKFGFGDNLQKNIAPFYGQAVKAVVAGIYKFICFLFFVVGVESEYKTIKI